MTDLSNWIPKPEAAARMGISERTLDRRCDAGTGPERRERQRPGLKPEPVYNPDDVERLAAPTAHLMPMETAMAPMGCALAPRSPSDLIPILERMVGAVESVLQTSASRDAIAILDRIATAVEKIAEPKMPLRWPPLLTVAQAAVYAGVSKKLIREAVRTKVLTAVRDGALRIRRADLDSDEIVSELTRLCSVRRDSDSVQTVSKLSKCPPRGEDLDSVQTCRDLSKYPPESPGPAAIAHYDRALPPSLPGLSENDPNPAFTRVYPSPVGVAGEDAEGQKQALTTVVRDA